MCNDCSKNFTSPDGVSDDIWPDAETFRMWLPDYLQDNPCEGCSKGGHAAYGQGVVTKDSGGNLTVGANYFMTYHTILRTSEDFYTAMEEARVVADNISVAMSSVGHHVEVFPYSIFYVFYEQYLTMWVDVLTSLGISMAAIFVVTFVLLGCDIHSSVVVLITITMIIVDLIGLMYWWNISLNAVSLVNLVMVSLSVCVF